MEAHDTAVRRIAAQVKTFHEAQKPFRIYHGSTNSTRTSHRRADNTIDTSGLNHVLSVDKTGMTALVEPNVPMDELVDATLAHGLVPPVVMEFPGITAGGGFSGTSGESSSFRLCWRTGPRRGRRAPTRRTCSGARRRPLARSAW
ncbi:hypothetical protein MAA_11545 [Metarhizium robertsii ARSEF 23]|uniref:Delta(24)-sterol reductase n=1 Tax=Metarhizium robertsii (strain ARSEF 23 / ATCC MYA-3075) TaxID=655844 RepID=A0A0B2XFR5_METRA|nr:uncharacterized protein MAA_11545 [Metarhizium robertsii ARSEF 23]KHO10864.1 hypothetical protein MAA_11545 [Metarhizium robertsii ARSEF 23]